jgi:hypothetical protein
MFANCAPSIVVAPPLRDTMLDDVSIFLTLYIVPVVGATGRPKIIFPVDALPRIV